MLADLHKMIQFVPKLGIAPTFSAWFSFFLSFLFFFFNSRKNMDLTGNHRQFPDIFMMQRFYCTDASNFYLLGNSLELQAHLFC